MKLSVVLPTYNEAGNIVELVYEILKNIPSGVDHEVIIVDDNSPDATYSIAIKEFAINPSVRVLLRTENRGFAKSIRHGIESAKGEYVIIMDTDFTHDPSLIPDLLHVASIYDVVSGSRFASGGNMQDQNHYIASLIYNIFLRLILRTQVQDNLGGYFIIKKDKITKLPLDKIFFGYGEYFFRLLHYSQLMGYSIVEIPAIYLVRTKGKSKSNFLKMLFTYTFYAINIKFNK